MENNKCLYCSKRIVDGICISGFWFCSQSHHVAYRINHNGKLPIKQKTVSRKRKREMRKCATCGKEFYPKRDSKMCCSPECSEEYIAFATHGDAFAMSFCPWRNIGVSQPGVPLEEQRQPDEYLGF